VSNDPWKDPDPKPDDFDADVSTIASEYIERHDGDPDATLRILVRIEGEDARDSNESPKRAARGPGTY
jgi:hypothetical protein